jgi:nitrate/nitrite transporter NarK
MATFIEPVCVARAPSLIPLLGGRSLGTRSQEGARTRTGGTNDRNSYLRDAVRVRAQHTAAQGGNRVNNWYWIEWYDFFLYGTAAGLIFGKLFFPNSDPLTATLAAFGTYFIGFVGRPIGAAIFGHYGDRIGRKATLIATLLCMLIATALFAIIRATRSRSISRRAQW